MRKNETEFKRFLKTQIGGWVDNIEQTRGSTHGFPDLLVLSGGLLGPVEVKVGKLEGGLLYPEEIRPAQISWLDRYQRAGGVARLVIGVRVKNKGRWIAFMKEDVSLGSISGWRNGWDPLALALLIDNGKLKRKLF